MSAQRLILTVSGLATCTFILQCKAYFTVSHSQANCIKMHENYALIITIISSWMRFYLFHSLLSMLFETEFSLCSDLQISKFGCLFEFEDNGNTAESFLSSVSHSACKCRITALTVYKVHVFTLHATVRACELNHI